MGFIDDIKARAKTSEKDELYCRRQRISEHMKQQKQF